MFGASNNAYGTPMLGKKTILVKNKTGAGKPTFGKTTGAQVGHTANFSFSAGAAPLFHGTSMGPVSNRAA